MTLRRRILRALRPISRRLDRINLRIGKPSLTGDRYHVALIAVRPGDIVLTRTKWRPTNLFVPGRWSHALMVVGDDVLVEATLPVVRTCWLVDVWASASEVQIMRASFLSDAQAAEAASIAASKVGTPYDLEFDAGPRELYCSELIYNALLDVAPRETPSLRTRQFGAWSIIPDRFADPAHFTRVM